MSANLIVQDAIRRSPHEALSLLIDPYRLCIEAPEGINLMLVQAVCEKISGRQKEPCLHKEAGFRRAYLVGGRRGVMVWAPTWIWMVL